MPPHSGYSIARMGTTPRQSGFGGCFFALACLTAQPASAEPCGLEQIGSGTAGEAVDGRTFRLDDGREVRLAAIESPAIPRDGDPRAAAGTAARTALHTLLSGRPVELRRLGPDSDRYGRIVAHVTVTGGEAPKPVQETLLAQGLARVAARVDHKACRASLLALEETARNGKLGLWADPYYVLRHAENPTDLLAETGRFAVVEGKVLSVRESGGTIYVNFGRRWTRDFAVTISKRQERQFAAAGIEPKKLEGRQIRVRGWIEERGGPRVEASRPEQIEVVR